MPLSKGRTASSDPYLELTDGILPLIDKLAELGYADPDRIGLMGHSFGGYSTCGLIEQTDRFRAAVEISGVTDLVSEQYSFLPGYRYQGYATDSVGYVVGFAPPWIDPQRYIRNSPIFHADKAAAPLLLIHGDQDGIIPMQQAEEFYYALWQAGKRARFVRYFGEEHSVQGKANVLDEWKEILGWFDHFLKQDTK
jgi:dipeptidyl aminopeptidase/acylaminoacyl peptidase